MKQRNPTMIFSIHNLPNKNSKFTGKNYHRDERNTRE